jgi:hypothetical protein
MARTSQALTEMPSVDAARSTCDLSPSGSRSVIRATSPDSASAAGGGSGGPGGAVSLTTRSAARPRSRTST